MQSKQRSSRSSKNVVSSARIHEESGDSKLFAFFLKYFWAVVAFLVVLTLVLPPEGNARNGDFVPILLPWFVVWIVSAFVARRRNNRKTSFETFPGRSDVVRPTATKFLETFEDRNSSRFLMKNILTKTFGRPDFWAIAFWSWTFLSLIVLETARFGNVRFARNSFWIWSGLIGIYFVFRSLRSILTPKIVRSLLILLIAVCLSESIFGFYSYSVRDPETRRQYLANPERFLKENGLNFAPDSAERILFENRLLNSFEPLGTFGLTNTLAGLLLPGLLVSCGFFFFFLYSISGTGSNVSTSFQKLSVEEKASILPKTKPFYSVFLRSNFGLIGLSFAVLFFLGTCLETTKSRSGLGALFVGFVLFAVVGFVCWVKRRSTTNSPKFYRTLKLLIGGFLLLLGLDIIAAFAFGIVDREVVTEIGKSLSYRWDYWVASSRMIADRFLFGVGPGNFQTIYPRYILPTASEFIADPHNFAFEIATNFGLPALIFFAGFVVSVLGAFAVELRRSVGAANSESKEIDDVSSTERTSGVSTFEYPATTFDEKSDRTRNDGQKESSVWFSWSIFWGSLIALPIGWAFSLSTSAPLDLDFILIAAVVFPATFGLFHAATVVVRRTRIAADACFDSFEAAKFESTARNARRTSPDVSSRENDRRRQKLFDDLFFVGLAAGLVAVLINLCAAGGIAYPATAFCFWFFAALLVDRSTVPERRSFDETNPAAEFSRSEPKRFFADRRDVGILILSIGFFGYFFCSELKPVWTERNFLANYPKSGKIKIDRDRSVSIPVNQIFYQEKTNAYLATFDFLKKNSTTNERNLNEIADEIERRRARLLEISPNSASIRFEIGETEFSLYRTTKNRAFLEAANDAILEAVLFSPTNAEYRVRASQTLNELGRIDEACDQARQAKELDEQTPHQDRKLSEPDRRFVEKILADHS